MSARVYSYGCGQPVSGWDYAQAEVERCRAMWDALVAIERAVAARELAQARADDPALDVLHTQIEAWGDALRSSPDDKETRGKRRAGYRESRRLIYAWRKAHKEAVRAFNDERVAQVVALRQRYTIEADEVGRLYWANSNRVLASYETGRKVAALRGRLIRPFDLERDDGVLAVQMQRTRTGLGAAPAELQDGTFAHLQFSSPDARGQARLSIRVDAAGNHLVLPVWIHRPLPKCRVKAAQLTWRRRADRLRYQLCLTVADDEPMRVRTAAAEPARVEFDWHDQGELEVLRIEERIWRLPQFWMARMDRIERDQGVLDRLLGEARERWGEHAIAGPLLALPTWRDRIGQLALARPRLPQEVIRWWVLARRLWLAIPGARAHVLGARREMYRIWAREIAARYPTLQLPDLDIAQIATAERGEERNSARHRAAVHTLRQEIIWQATKAGTPVIDASGAVLNASEDSKSSAWARRKAGKARRYAMA